jgi:hypothetical protein
VPNAVRREEEECDPQITQINADFQTEEFWTGLQDEEDTEG